MALPACSGKDSGSGGSAGMTSTSSGGRSGSGGTSSGGGSPATGGANPTGGAATTGGGPSGGVTGGASPVGGTSPTAGGGSAGRVDGVGGSASGAPGEAGSAGSGGGAPSTSGRPVEKALPDLAQILQEHSVAALDGEGYVIGGYAANQVTDQVQAYSPSTNQWRQVAKFPAPMNHGNAGTVNGKIYVAGFYITGMSGATTQTFAYDSNADSWRSEEHTSELQSQSNLV